MTTTTPRPIEQTDAPTATHPHPQTGQQTGREAARATAPTDRAGLVWPLAAPSWATSSEIDGRDVLHIREAGRAPVPVGVGDPQAAPLLCLLRSDRLTLDDAPHADGPALRLQPGAVEVLVLDHVLDGDQAAVLVAELGALLAALSDALSEGGQAR